MRKRENIASGLEMRELTYYFFQLAGSFFLLALVVAIFCVNLKVPGRMSEEKKPNVWSCLQMPSRRGSPSSWEQKPARKIPGFAGRARLETELAWRGQRCLGEAGEQPWLCYFLWLWAENYRGSPGRRGRVILMEAQLSSAGRGTEGWKGRVYGAAESEVWPSSGSWVLRLGCLPDLPMTICNLVPVSRG